MAQMLVRALDANYEPQYGNGSLDFLTDIDAVAQIIGTKLRLLQGEWWEDLNAGVPLFQSMLGKAGGTSAIPLILQQTITSVPYVTGINSFSGGFNPSIRTYAFSASVQTSFGAVTITNQPGASASLGL